MWAVHVGWTTEKWTMVLNYGLGYGLEIKKKNKSKVNGSLKSNWTVEPIESERSCIKLDIPNEQNWMFYEYWTVFLIKVDGRLGYDGLLKLNWTLQTIENGRS